MTVSAGHVSHPPMHWTACYVTSQPELQGESQARNTSTLGSLQEGLMTMNLLQTAWVSRPSFLYLPEHGTRIRIKPSVLGTNLSLALSREASPNTKTLQVGDHCLLHLRGEELDRNNKTPHPKTAYLGFGPCSGIPEAPCLPRAPFSPHPQPRPQLTSCRVVA